MVTVGREDFAAADVETLEEAEKWIAAQIKILETEEVKNVGTK
jgi:hypothetical protein